MFARQIKQEILDSIARVPAVVLLGARQVGKTTLAKAIGQDVASIYLDLESPEDLLKLSSPLDFLRLHRDKLVILDEIQRTPNLFEVLRGLIDQNTGPAQKRANGQFLLLGSASPALLRQSSESLAGRIHYIQMGGLNVPEIGEDEADQRRLWLRGGFPDSYLASNDAQSMHWLEDLIRTYLERDVPQMGYRVPATRLRRLWTMLAHQQGEPANCSQLGGSLELTAKTVQRYIDILVDLLLVRRLNPWHANAKKRLVKAPRYYIRDSGILHRLLGIHSDNALRSHPGLGKSWEGFAIENIHSVLPPLSETCFYRTMAGAEIDLVIQLPSSQTWAVEIKYGSAPKPGKHYSKTCDDVGADRKYILYSGNDEFPLANGVTMISLPRLMEELRGQVI